MTKLMNKYQRIVIAAGMCLVLLAGLFPPYVGMALRQGDNFTVYMGHYFLLVPPSWQKVYAKIEGKPAEKGWNPRHWYCRYRATALTSLVWVEFAVIVLLTGGGVLLLAPKKDRSISGSNANT